MLLSRAGIPLRENTLKLVDFGFARTFERGEKDLTTKCGTMHFIAPEVFSEDRFNEKCDMWSAGVILYLFLSGQPPFDDEDDDELILQAAMGHLDFECEPWDRVAPTAKLAIMQMCKVDPDARFSADAALQGTWIQDRARHRGSSDAEESGLTSSIVCEGLQRFQRMSKARKASAYLVALNVTDAQQSQVSSIRSKFEELDVRGDGVLSLAEVQKGLADLSLKGDVVEKMFQDIDQKGSGVVEWSEFLSLMLDQRVLGSEDTITSNREVLWAAFKVLDQRNTLQVGVEELFDVIGHIDARFTRQEAEAFLKEADTDGDGKLSFEEFAQLFDPAPKQTTRTNVGLVTANEAKPRPSIAPTRKSKFMSTHPKATQNRSVLRPIAA